MRNTKGSGSWLALRILSSSTSFATIGVGLLVLIGWAAGLEWVKRVSPALVAMNPMTAVLFVILGLSLWLKQRPPNSHSAMVASVMAVLVVIAAAAKLTGLFFHLQFGIDAWLFAGSLAGSAQTVPNRMASTTAISFLLLGLSVAFLDKTLSRGRRPSEFLAIVAAFIALLALLGYAYRINSMTGFSNHIPMALNTAVTFLMVTVGIFAARPDVGWMGLITGSGPGGTMARAMLPALVLMIAGIGWLRVYGESIGAFSSERGVAIYTLTIIALCVALTLWSARSLDKAAARQKLVERQRAHAFSELQQSEARIRSILDTAYDAFISIDAEGKVIDWNVAAEKMFGRSRGESIGKYLTSLIVPAKHRDAHEQGLARARSASGPTGNMLNCRVEMAAMHRDGSEFPTQMTIWPLMLGGRRTFNAFIADTSQRTAAERNIQALHAELVAKAGQLENSNKELEAFSYSISHDLRAPLRHIDGYARMLQEDAADKLDGETRRYLDEIGDAARRMGGLIDNLLAFSRLGRKAMQYTEVDMDALVNGVLRENVDSRGARVVIDSLPAVHADPLLIKQAWVNLVSNAVKYSSPRGEDARIEITGERIEGGVRYEIRDNGVGFDMQYIDKLFGVFQRLHSDEEFEGSGVGLAIVQRIITRHGGSISAVAEPGIGATFNFEIPDTRNEDTSILEREPGTQE